MKDVAFDPASSLSDPPPLQEPWLLWADDSHRVATTNSKKSVETRDVHIRWPREIVRNLIGSCGSLPMFTQGESIMVWSMNSASEV